MNLRILSHQQRLDSLYAKVALVTTPQEQMEWSKYLCVLTAGYIEESLRVLILEHAKNNSSTKIQRFIEKEISYVTNCKTERILEVLNKFDPKWSTTFESEINNNSPIDKEIKDSIDSIVSNRHLIAHGKSVGMTYTTIKRYYGYCKIAIQILENTVM
ncbi:HEPN domain-containing protein [Spirosoma linguale]|uniref:RiboL-PSP-HEPN domain-containing protein n=1 Tax=Spirosoma linguale (strain ATCC 33905 / DSM 74 / LMG 10896 / Claus 1) TaxID=504472 RepID=D2QBE7_SPILD|nr:hypothetical protein Slin_0056 [Spirosoma linguale DSM 74]